MGKESMCLSVGKMRSGHSSSCRGTDRVRACSRDSLMAAWRSSSMLGNWLKVAQSLCSAEEAKEFHFDVLAEEINSLEKSLAGADQKIGFCHNDLQYGNAMIDEETRQITIIDYEYASFNPVAYDVANHFCEMAADYHSDTPHILDYSKYPDLEERKRFVYIYMKSSGKSEARMTI
ncbi:hypothetical protein KSP40_PGU017871 [Platanthera guangdongensis]|uniref:Choline kinase n=1 Tax=Platanthera guangdongensis TaxID=2320717 RepID=A0ABR2LG94_9ASPA